MAQDVIIRGVTYQGVDKLSLPVLGGSALFRDTSDGDAVAGEIMNGKKAYNANGAVNGSMVNQGAVSGTISDKDTPYTIPAGYHNGSGTVDIASAQKALLLPGNIRNGVTILGVTGTYSGGGGGPTASDAILTVTVPTGSTVTMTKGVTLTPTMWVQAADPTLDCALFVIAPSLFDSQNAWTVTATLGQDTAANTVTVDSNEQYDVELFYTYYLYKDGNEFSRITGGWEWTAESGDGTYVNNTSAGQMEVKMNTTGSTYQSFLHTVNKISVSEWSAVKALIKHTAGKNTQLVISSTAVRNASPVTYTITPISTNFELVTLDVTSYTGEYYIGIKTNAYGTKFFASAVWCE